MTYAQWFEAHSSKHQRLNQKLLSQGLCQEDIIKYYRFENMVEKEPDFCELYKDNKKCHEMEELNCYLCACPNFRFTMSPHKKNDKIIHSHCSIESKDGAIFEHENNLHQDCSGCQVPHHEAYISKNFDTSWDKIMKKCEED
ncbi:MAG: hypothetical protein COA44_06790 [Arcobacter sp.]|nr:MAG: hypothetical protein COA44_06790 [Arcobacter sp.]